MYPERAYSRKLTALTMGKAMDVPIWMRPDVMMR